MSYFSFPTSQQVNPPEPIPEEPIYGEGMVLLNPSTGRALAAESQTGTWYEEKAAEEEVKKAQEPKPEYRPTMPVSRKSVRLSQSSIRAALEPLQNGTPDSPPKSAPHTEVDQATIALGVGWTQMSSEDPDLQAAARGWARYLENHYSRHIHGAEILLKNRGLDAYLVGCQEGFFLFTEDLLRGQLVGRSWEICLNNLRCQPIQFEGSEILTAERTPGPETDDASKQAGNDWSDLEGLGRQAQYQGTTNGFTQTNAITNGVSSGGMDLD